MQSGIFFFKSPRWAAHLYSGPLRIGVQLPLEIVLHQLTQRLVHRLLAPTSRGICGLSQRRSWRRCCCQGGEKQDKVETRWSQSGENQDQTCTKSRHHCSCDLPRCVGRLKGGDGGCEWMVVWVALGFPATTTPLSFFRVRLENVCESPTRVADCWALCGGKAQVHRWGSGFLPTDYLPRNKRASGQNGC